MRNLVLVRGPQGSGKSRLVSRLGLEGHHLSYDMARQLVCGDAYGLDGTMRVSQEQNRLAVALTRESLERRFADGETVVFEATMPSAKEVRTIVDLATRHRYAVLVVDLYGVPPHDALLGNASRPERLRVPEHAVLEAYAKYAQNPPVDVETVRVRDRVSLTDATIAVEAFLMRGLEPLDLSAWDRVIHVGDLQGTLHPILDPRSPLADGVPDDAFVVFTGDLFDRGVENGAVARWWLDHAQGRPNVRLIAGNHEDHVEREADGLPSVSREWSQRTMPQLRAAGIGRADLEAIADSTIPFVRYAWRGRDVLCTHGGLSRVPSRPELLSVRTLRKGVGMYGHGIDGMWTDAQSALPEAERTVQVHGHRNARILPTRTSEEALSFNLEGQVEFGGHMRFAVLDDSGWSTIDIRSREYRTMVEAHLIDDAEQRQAHGDSAPLAPWAREGRATLEPIAPATLAAFEDHAMIASFASTTLPHVSSVNFTKSAFYSKGWDAWTTVARGLFVDTVDGTIVSRSYPKFWNHGERRETSDEALQENLVFPVDCFEKANGFLCTTGYSERTGQLVVTSKSRIEGDFADWAREILGAALGDAGMERLMRFNRDQVASLVFEIVDPVRDPHVIEYAEAGVVLLGCVRRGEAFEQMPYEDLVRLAKWLGCPVKRRLAHGLKDWHSLSRFMDRAENDPTWLAANPIEGVVVQDSNPAGAYQFKVKASFYRDWKRMRGAVERIALAKRAEHKGFDRARYAEMAAFQPFLDWAETLSVETLGIGIIALRNAWLGDPAAADAMRAPPAPPKLKDMTGFLKGVDAIAAQVAAGTAKTDTVRRLVEGADADPDRSAALASHPHADALRAFVAASA